MEDNNRLSYFFLGMGLGVAIGLLFAPKSGEETRKIIRSKADDSKKYVQERTSEVRQSATGLVDRSREAVSRQKDQLAAAVEAGKSAYKDTVSEPSEAPESSS